MKIVKDTKIEIKVNGANVLDSREPIKYEVNKDGSISMKCNIGTKNKQELVINFIPFHDETILDKKPNK